MNKVYTVVLVDKNEYEMFDSWTYAEDYIAKNKGSKIRVATFTKSESGMEKLIDFVNYCFKGTTYKGSIIANSEDAVQVALATKTVKGNKFSSWALIYRGREIIRIINKQYPCKDMTIEQESIIDILKEITILFPTGTEILLGVQQDYLVNMFLEFYKPKSSKSKVFYSELNKYTHGYAIEIVKANNYIDTKEILRVLKLCSKGE